MLIKKIGLGLLMENTWNPNFMTDKEFQALVKQIKSNGMRQPILVRPFEEMFQIIDGAHRARASKKAGLKEIDCVIIELSDNHAKTATIAMNQIKGEMDDISLAKLLEELKKDLKASELSELSGIEEKRIEILLKLLELPEDLSELAKTPDHKEMTLTFSLTDRQAEVVEKALNSIDASNKTFSLLCLCKKHLAQLEEKQND